MDQLVNLSSSLLSTTINTAAWSLKPILKVIEKGAASLPSSSSSCSAQQLVVKEIHSLPPTMRKWLALTGVMGASAVAIGAWGAHVVYPRKEISDARKAIFETASKYHFLHSLALITVPFARKSSLTGGLFLVGTVVFSGSCYYSAVTDNRTVTKYTPYGGIMLILGWLSLAL